MKLLGGNGGFRLRYGQVLLLCRGRRYHHLLHHVDLDFLSQVIRSRSVALRIGCGASLLFLVVLIGTNHLVVLLLIISRSEVLKVNFQTEPSRHLSISLSGDLTGGQGDRRRISILRLLHHAGSAKFHLLLFLLLLRRHDCLGGRGYFFGRLLPIDHLEAHDGLESAQLAIRANHWQVVDQELVVPRFGGRLILPDNCPLNWGEILQIDIDVGEIVVLCLRLLEQLHHNGQALLPEDLDRVDRRVQDGDFVLAPLFRLEL